jgi:hypothetical protein
MTEHAAIELHDSELEAIEWDSDGTLALRIDAVLHTSEGEPGVSPGLNWAVAALIHVDRASVLNGTLAPDELAGGTLTIDGRATSNCLPVPLSAIGAVLLQLETYHGEVSISGSAIRIRTDGQREPRGRFPGST